LGTHRMGTSGNNGKDKDYFEIASGKRVKCRRFIIY